ncbi:MAG: ABC transporter permease, partial [Anaerolineae bacterium]|nr:ABC transporter permease [Anaerolineae bacterium]
MNSMVPGLLAIVLIMPTMALALALTREKETGTLEGLLATPVSGTEYLVG